MPQHNGDNGLCCGPTTFRLHCCSIWDYENDIGYDVAMLNFSVSQIVGSGEAARQLVHNVLGKRLRCWCIGIIGHDHCYDACTTEDVGVTLTPPLVPVCDGRGCSALMCVCHGCHDFRAARLRTVVGGTRMANGIEEYAFGLEVFRCALRKRTRVWFRRPHCNRPSNHWLLRSLFGMVIINRQCDDDDC
jgi:hypothetical protein